MTLLITLTTLITLGLEPSRTSLVSLPMYLGIGSTVLYFPSHFHLNLLSLALGLGLLNST